MKMRWSNKWSRHVMLMLIVLRLPPTPRQTPKTSLLGAAPTCKGQPPAKCLNALNLHGTPAPAAVPCARRRTHPSAPPARLPRHLLRKCVNVKVRRK